MVPSSKSPPPPAHTPRASTLITNDGWSGRDSGYIYGSWCWDTSSSSTSLWSLWRNSSTPTIKTTTLGRRYTSPPPRGRRPAPRAADKTKKKKKKKKEMKRTISLELELRLRLISPIREDRRRPPPPPTPRTIWSATPPSPSPSQIQIQISYGTCRHDHASFASYQKMYGSRPPPAPPRRGPRRHFLPMTRACPGRDLGGWSARTMPPPWIKTTTTTRLINIRNRRMKRWMTIIVTGMTTLLLLRPSIPRPPGPRPLLPPHETTTPTRNVMMMMMIMMMMTIRVEGQGRRGGGRWRCTRQR